MLTIDCLIFGILGYVFYLSLLLMIHNKSVCNSAYENGATIYQKLECAGAAILSFLGAGLGAFCKAYQVILSFNNVIHEIVRDEWPYVGLDISFILLGFSILLFISKANREVRVKMIALRRRSSGA